MQRYFLFISGMLCSLCIDHHPPRQGGILVWIDVPCTTLIKFSLTRHASSKQHQEAMDMASQAQANKASGTGIDKALSKHVNVEKMAFLAALRGMYWLAKSEIPHTTKFESLLGMMQGLGVSYLSHLYKVIIISSTLVQEKAEQSLVGVKVSLGVVQSLTTFKF